MYMTVLLESAPQSRKWILTLNRTWRKMMISFWEKKQIVALPGGVL